MPSRPQIYCCVIGTSTGCFKGIFCVHVGISNADNKEIMMETLPKSHKTVNDVLNGFDNETHGNIE
jgi:hypothetical protein